MAPTTPLSPTTAAVLTAAAHAPPCAGQGGQRRKRTYICPVDHYEQGVIYSGELNRTLVQPLPQVGREAWRLGHGAVMSPHPAQQTRGCPTLGRAGAAPAGDAA